MSDVSSIPSESEAGDRDKIEDIVLEEPIFYVLSQFLETDNNKNIATILQELTTEVREVKALFARYIQMQSKKE
jgi:hypothetical protein